MSNPKDPSTSAAAAALARSKQGMKYNLSPAERARRAEHMRRVNEKRRATNNKHPTK